MVMLDLETPGQKTAVLARFRSGGQGCYNGIDFDLQLVLTVFMYVGDAKLCQNLWEFRERGQ